MLGISFAAAADEPAKAPRPTITIFAASSLQEAMRAVAARFTAEHGIDVRFSFAGSQELRAQLEQGASADLFASADQRHADALVHEGLGLAAKSFASNALVIAVAKGNPEQVKGLADLVRVKHLVIGVREVPVGAYAEKLFALADARTPGLAAQLEKRVSSRELNVRQVLAKVALGEAEAGIVYRTDVLAMADRVDAVPLEPALEQPTEDVIEVLAHAANREGADAFVLFLLSREGQAALQAQGFRPAATP